jgi:hypothetical protein
MDPDVYVIRNSTSDTLELRLDGRRFVAEPDEVVQIPAELYETREWPESLWTLVSSPAPAAPKKAAAKKKDD